MHEVHPAIARGGVVVHPRAECYKQKKHPVALVAIRLTVVKEFTDPAVWNAARGCWTWYQI